MSSEGKTDAPVAGMNPGADGLPAGLAVAGFQAVYTGLMFAALKYGDAENALPFEISAEVGGCALVLFSGLVQGMMGSKTNWARVEYNVPWPHTFGLEKNKDKLKFDMVQRAHLNFVENYPQFYAIVYFALQFAPKLTTICGTIFLLGRIVFALGYYSGDAGNKNQGAFGYMLGIFPVYGLCWLYLLTNIGVVSL